jgi:hypothetical protein
VIAPTIDHHHSAARHRAVNPYTENGEYLSRVLPSLPQTHLNDLAHIGVSPDDLVADFLLQGLDNDLPAGLRLEHRNMLGPDPIERMGNQVIAKRRFLSLQSFDLRSDISQSVSGVTIVHDTASLRNARTR